jgi:prepilin-type processing-associated H-X9-DG protein
MQVSVTNGGTMEFVASGRAYPHFQVISNELGTARILLCPNDGERVCATNFFDLKDRNLSYFLNVDAREGDSASLLSGDRNITNRAPERDRLVSLTGANTIAWTEHIHSEKGNLCFGDGSVGSFRNGSVGTSVKIQTGMTNRLAVP